MHPPTTDVRSLLLARPSSGPWRMLRACCLAMALVASAPAAGQVTIQEQDDFRIWKAVLENPTSDASLMQASALRLINSGWPSAIELLESHLGQFDRPIRIAAISAALRETPIPPEALGAVLIERLTQSPADLVPLFADAISAFSSSIVPDLLVHVKDKTAPVKTRVAFISALARFTEVEVVDELIACLEPEEPKEIRIAAISALRSVTGVDHGSVMSRWQAWWRSQRLQGREGLVVRKMEALEQRLEASGKSNLESQQEIAALQNELLASLNRVYALTDSEQRFALLATWLQSPRPAVRRMSLDLVEQRVLNAEPVPVTMTDTVAALIADPDPGVSREAVQCLALLNQSLAARTVAPLLTQNLDPAFEEVVITVLSKTAEPSAVPELLARFQLPDRSRLVSQAMLTACQAGFVTPADRDAIAQTILATNVTMRDRAAVDVELLAWAPGVEAQASMTALFADAQSSPDLKLAAARGILQSGEHLDLLSMYARDAAVEPWALQWAAATPSLERLRLIAAWKPHDPDAYAAAINKIMAALAPGDWPAADDVLQSIDSIKVESRIGWLARILTLNSSQAPDAGPDSVPALPVRRALFIRLAELHYAQANIEAMLTVVQAANGNMPSPALDRLRAIALAANGQFDVPGNAPPAPDILIDALDLVLRAPEPRLDVAQIMVDRLAVIAVDTLDQAAQTRLADLTSRLDALLAQRSNAEVDSDG